MQITSKAQRNASGKDDPLVENPIEGGPKTSLTPEDEVESSKLSETVDISPDLNYPSKIEIAMKPETVPISLLPYHVSPENHKVINEQMDLVVTTFII